MRDRSGLWESSLQGEIKMRSYYALLASLPPHTRVSLQYYLAHGRPPDLAVPQTFSEKVQRRKLYEPKSRLARYSDKLAIKGIIAQELGPKFVTPTLFSGKSLPAELDWPLPFVMKANHASGWNYIVSRPEERNEPLLRSLAARWLRMRYNPELCEAFYDEIEPRILIEPLLGEPGTLPPDYKFYVFGGRAHYIMVVTDRLAGKKLTFYDTNWRRQPFAYTYPSDNREIPKPPHLAEMIEAAETLARPFSFARVDLYDLEEGPRVGEVTFCPESGFMPFRPVEADLALGALWPDPQPGGN